MNIIEKTSVALAMTTLSTICPAQDSIGISTDSLCIDIQYMMPQRYSAKAVTNFSLCLKGDTVISYLPYMGRANQPTFGSTDNMNFSRPIRNKSIKHGKKGKNTITFNCRNNAIDYAFKIEIYPKGGAYIHLVPSNADAISYRGEWK